MNLITVFFQNIFRSFYFREVSADFGGVGGKLMKISRLETSFQKLETSFEQFGGTRRLEGPRRLFSDFFF